MAVSSFTGPLAAAGGVPLSVSANSVFGSNSDFDPCGFVSTSSTPGTVASGGVAPYTYAWTKISDADGANFNISSAVAQNPSWNGTRCDFHADNSEGWRVTVTDANSDTATADIQVTLTWINLN